MSSSCREVKARAATTRKPLTKRCKIKVFVARATGSLVAQRFPSATDVSACSKFSRNRATMPIILHHSSQDVPTRVPPLGSQLAKWRHQNQRLVTVNRATCLALFGAISIARHFIWRDTSNRATSGLGNAKNHLCSRTQRHPSICRRPSRRCRHRPTITRTTGDAAPNIAAQALRTCQKWPRSG